MINLTKVVLLKLFVPLLALIFIAIHLLYVNKYSLNKWKGGGYGMYTSIHYASNQIYIPGMSVDSLRKVNDVMKSTLDYLLLMPNDNNLKKAAKLVLETTQKDSVLIQVWEPKVNANDGSYTRVLVNELNLKN